MKRLMKLTTHNAKSIYTEAYSMNILKPNVAVGYDASHGMTENGRNPWGQMYFLLSHRKQA